MQPSDKKGKKMEAWKVQNLGPSTKTLLKNKNHRKLKSSTGAAASAGALDGGEAEQMKLEAMIGSFFIHWVLMGISILICCWQLLLQKEAKTKRKQQAY
jgi:hypothetical protein